MDVFGGLLSFVGGERANASREAIAREANAFSAQQFATRYQTTVKDMQAAGLNPMLAYSQGGGTPPSGQQAQVQDTISPAVEAARSVSLTSAQKELLGAQAKAAEAQADAASAQAAKTRAETVWVDPRASSEINLQGVTAGMHVAQTKMTEAAEQKVLHEIPNVVLQGKHIEEDIRRVRALYLNLAESSALMAQQGATEIQRQRNLQAATRKLIAEGKITEADYRAMEQTGFFGRVAREVKPVSDMAADWVGLGAIFKRIAEQAKPRSSRGTSTHYDADGNVTGGHSYESSTR